MKGSPSHTQLASSKRIPKAVSVVQRRFEQRILPQLWLSRRTSIGAVHAACYTHNSQRRSPPAILTFSSSTQGMGCWSRIACSSKRKMWRTKPELCMALTMYLACVSHAMSMLTCGIYGVYRALHGTHLVWHTEKGARGLCCAEWNKLRTQHAQCHQSLQQGNARHPSCCLPVH